jgi:hypothetical protein
MRVTTGVVGGSRLAIVQHRDHPFTSEHMPRTASKNRGLTPGISRIDQPTTRTHGYFVRVGYRKTTKGWRPKASAFFGDASHGGKSSALRAAEKWLKSNKRGGSSKRGRAA